MKELLAIGSGLSLAAALMACGSADAGEVPASTLPRDIAGGAAVAAGPVAAPTAVQVVWPEGLYGDVRLGAESGDLGGFEIRFYERDGVHMAEFVLCEGWCNASYHSQVRRDGDGFVVESVEPLFSDRGTENHNVRYRLTPVQGGLQLAGWYDGRSMEFWGNCAPLPPLKKSFGLDVANHASE